MEKIKHSLPVGTTVVILGQETKIEHYLSDVDEGYVVSPSIRDGECFVRLWNKQEMKRPMPKIIETQIWYMRPEHFRDGNMGFNYCKSKGCLPDQKNLSATHVLLKTSQAQSDPDQIFALMQGENWSPKGEANDLIRSKGLQHTSMSIGDVLVQDGQALVCDWAGWKQLGGILWRIIQKTLTMALCLLAGLPLKWEPRSRTES